MKSNPLTENALRRLALELGADDVGFASVQDRKLAESAQDAETLLRGARTYISLVLAMNPEHVRSAALSVAICTRSGRSSPKDSNSRGTRR